MNHATEKNKLTKIAMDELMQGAFNPISRTRMKATFWRGIRDCMIRVLDERYPDTGLDNPMFAVMLVVYLAAVTTSVDPRFLSYVTGYSARFVRTIYWNMWINGLWTKGYYDASVWFSENKIIDDIEFWEQIQVADGSAFCSGVDSSMSIDPGNPYEECV